MVSTVGNLSFVKFRKNTCFIFSFLSVLKTKLVRARMDQSNRKVFISSTMHRTFGRAQWQQLRDLLCSWKANLGGITEGMKAITATHMEMPKQ